MLLRDRMLRWLLLWLPLLSMLLVWGLYSSGAPRQLPVGVIQSEISPLSQAIGRQLQASPLLELHGRYQTLVQAQQAMQRGEIYAALALPRHLERDSQLGLRPTITAWYNGQLMLMGTQSARGIQRALLDLASSDNAPVQLEINALYNTHSNYVPFLVATALPTLWQAGIMFAAAYVADRYRPRYALSLNMTFTVLAMLPGLAVLAGIYGWLGWPMAGNGWTLLLAQLLLVLSAQGIAVALRLLSGDLLRAFSLIGGFCAPAFAFSGITFPTQAMPELARLWQQLMPVYHYLQLQLGQTSQSLSLSGQAEHWLALALLLLAWPLVWLLRKLDIVTELGQLDETGSKSDA